MENYKRRLREWNAISNSNVKITENHETITFEINHDVNMQWSKYQCLFNIGILEHLSFRVATRTTLLLLPVVFGIGNATLAHHFQFNGVTDTKRCVPHGGAGRFGFLHGLLLLGSMSDANVVPVDSIARVATSRNTASLLGKNW